MQGFNENASVLLTLAACAALLAPDVPIVALMWGFGLAIALAVGLLIVREVWRLRMSAREPQANTAKMPEIQE